MKTIIATVLAAFSLSAFAAGSWATVNTKEYAKGDKEPSTAKATNYAAYYCTVAAAEQMFGGSTVDVINDYLVKNFSDGKAAMGKTAGSVAIDQQASYADGQYAFTEYYGTDIAQGEYLAVTFFENATLQAFRVFGKENAVWDVGTLTFDDQAAGTVGDWTTVPEPTSGLLFLLGSALLALKRKQA